MNQGQWTEEETKLRSEYGNGQQDFFDALEAFRKQHEGCDLVITNENFNSPVGVVYFFKPVKERMQQLAAVKSLLKTLEEEGKK